MRLKQQHLKRHCFTKIPKDHPLWAKSVSCPKTVFGPADENGVKAIKSAPTPIQEFHGYNRRKKHVQKSQEVPFCTNLHIDFLQSSK